MFEIFANIFERFEKPQDRLPQSLIEAATERAIDGTDPRLRIESGYARRLRQPVIHAVQHILRLVDSLPAPGIVLPGQSPSQPDLAALLHSGDRLQQLVRSDASLAQFRSDHPLAPDVTYALLVVRATEKRGFGAALVDGEPRAEVARTTVNFSDHQLVDPAADIDTTLQLVKRRAFDALLACALAALSEQRHEREQLTQRRALLRAKLDIFRRHGGFADQQVAGDQARAQRQMEQIERQLQALGDVGEVLSGQLATVAEVLSRAEHHIWLEPAPLCLDRYYVAHPPGGEVAEVPFTRICASTGERRTLRLLGIAAGR